MTHWESTLSSPATTEDYLYDGAGQRIQKKTVSGSTTTPTCYIGGGIEEAQSVNGGTVTLTKYLGAPGLPQAIRVGTSGTLSYLASDGLASVSEALDSSGTVTAQQLYAPYGGLRYTNGAMPTSKGFTGQRQDSASSGLDYYGARYYDPVLGQFASADTIADGLNRYGYVHGNPTTFTDPDGHRANCFGPDGCFSSRDSGDPRVISDINQIAGYLRVHLGMHAAVVGPGKKVQDGDDTHPVKYQWGDDTNKVEAEGYYGKNLKHKIDHEKADRSTAQWWLTKLDLWPEWLSYGVGIIAAIVTFLISENLALAEKVGGYVAMGVALAVEALRGVLRQVISALTATINVLQGAYDAGKTVWYVTGYWKGQVRNQACGGADFCVGKGLTPPSAVIQQVGVDAYNQCQGAPTWISSTSPGVGPSEVEAVCS